MISRGITVGLVLTLAVAVAGCAARSAFNRAETAATAGDVDQAVVEYRAALQADPGNAQYEIALNRAMLTASRAHLDRARGFEEKDELEAARNEYQLAAGYDPTNRAAMAKATELDRIIRDRIQASRPRPAIEQMREEARTTTAPPVLNPASRERLVLRFSNTNLRDILDFIGNSTGINVSYDRDVTDRAVSIQLEGVTLEEALRQLMLMNQLSYKVLSERSIFIFPDTQVKHVQYDDQVVQTFYISHADPTELTQILSTVTRLPGIAVQPIFQANKTTNTIVVRGTREVVQIIEKIIAQNDKPRAEIVIDVSIMEVNRTRAQQYGLNLSDYALGVILSPEATPPAESTPPNRVQSPPAFPFGSATPLDSSDWYLAVPTAVVRFLESDTNTKLIAKPQLRGAEGSKLTLNLGDDIPVISTSYTPLAAGGAGVNPLNSYNYRSVGVNIDMTPRVTVEGDIILDLTLDNSSLGPNVLVAGVLVPSFGKRTVTTRLRLRNGESNLLAGLLREDERKALTGFPGAIHVPILRQLFSSNDNTIAQTDIVMLLTPHVIRTNEVTVEDLKPIYIGSQQNLGLGGPPPLIGGPAPDAEPAPLGAPPVPQAAAPGAQPVIGAGSVPSVTSPTPGTTFAPPVPAGSAPLPTPVPSSQSPQAASLPEPAVAGGAGTQVMLSPPGVSIRVGGGPYTFPISVLNASRLSTLSLTITFDPGLLKVRSIQEGSFMRSGGVAATFTQQAAPGRVDIAISRIGDVTGASGTGLLGAVLFDPAGPGMGTLTLSGVGTSAGGAPVALQFRPVPVSIEP